MQPNSISQRTSLPPLSHSEVREIAAIDLGSNSFHMIIARIINGSVQILSRLKQKVQLAEGLDENNYLNQSAITRGVNCLALFAERLQGFPAENVNVVGTYTLRQAVNNQEFLRQAQQVFPYPINIISGQTEASMIYAGVSHTQPEAGLKFVVDIGGGSTEMIIGEDFDPILVQSRNMGCVSFAQRFFPQGVISEQNFTQAYQHALQTIADLAEEYKTLGWRAVLGSSGTIKTVHQVIAASMDKDGLITRPRLQRLVEQILRVKHFDQLKLVGLKEERADVFVPGVAILSAVFDTFQIGNMRYSDGALREGVIYSLEDNFQVTNIRQRTALSLAKQFNLDRTQAAKVHQTSWLLLQQFNGWQNTNLVDEMAEILLWAAQLHEVGIVVNHRGMQRHSAYILQHSELPGFDPEQKKLLTTLVRYQIQSFRKQSFSRFIRYSAQDVVSLLCLLRLAIILNKSRQATEYTDKISLKKGRASDQWCLQFEEGYLQRNPLIKNELKIESQFWRDNDLVLTF